MRSAAAKAAHKIVKFEIFEGSDMAFVVVMRMDATASSKVAASPPAEAMHAPVRREAGADRPSPTFGWARPLTLDRATAVTA